VQKKKALSVSKTAKASRKTQAPTKESLGNNPKEQFIVQAPLPIKKAIKKIVKKNEYFTKLHEEAILKYAISNDKQEKSVLYVTLIQPAFNEMVDKIVFTYKFTSLPNIEDLKEECKIWLTTILDKFDASKGSKAFSYFSVITKNWFIHKVKKNSNGREVSLDEITQEFEEDHLFILNNYDTLREKNEFWQALWLEIDTWDSQTLKINEKKVYEAVRLLLKDPEGIEIFNKKAIYLYIREMTGLSTKQIVVGLKKFKFKYNYFVQKWNRGLITHLKVQDNVEKEPTTIN
jgi:DNA-directed RNA polymerase specialized sigma subunit